MERINIIYLEVRGEYADQLWDRFMSFFINRDLDFVVYFLFAVILLLCNSSIYLSPVLYSVSFGNENLYLEARSNTLEARSNTCQG